MRRAGADALAWQESGSAKRTAGVSCNGNGITAKPVAVMVIAVMEAVANHAPVAWLVQFEVESVNRINRSGGVKRAEFSGFFYITSGIQAV